MSNAQWFYGRDGVQRGPVGEAEVKRMLATGGLRTTDVVWTDGMTQWQPAGEVAAFAANMSAMSPPPIQPPPLRPVGMPAGGAQIGYAGPQYGYPGLPQHDIGQNAGMRMLLPVGRSGWAIASGYCGLLSILPLVGCLFGIAAVITGLLAISDMRRNPHRHGMGRAIFGLVAGAIFTLVWGLAFVTFVAGRM